MKHSKTSIFIIVIITIFLQSCASQRNKQVSWAAADYQVNLSESESLHRGGDFHSISFEKTSKVRKVLFSAQLTMTVVHVDTANIELQAIASKYNGYVSQLGSQRTIIRVEGKHLNHAIDDISKLGKIQSKNITGQDVTDEYLDYGIRLENAEKSRARYLELLEKAENVEAALKVEKELERLNETIDILKGKMNQIEHLAEYSTITIHLRERTKPGILGYVGIGLYHTVKWLFVRN
jgi:hypothetical protein